MNLHFQTAQEIADKLRKALKHLKYTYAKVQQLPTDYSLLDEEQLETWESFSSRFSRVADLFLTRFLRSRILQEDPGFSGTLRDTLHFAEKIGLIQNANEWLSIRELRNLAAHEYLDENLSRHFRLLKENTPKLLLIEKILDK